MGQGAALLAGIAGIACAGEAQAQDAEAAQKPPKFAIAGNIAIVSDYVFRGVSLSDNDFALQGGFNLSAPHKINAGIWASSIETLGGSELEVDLFASKTVQLGKTEVLVGGTGYIYPGSTGLNYGEGLLTASRNVGPVDVTIGGLYAWQQRGLSGRDNFYGFVNAAAPLGELHEIPFTLAASFGQESGFFDLGQRKFDWSLKLTASKFGFDISVGYTDTNIKSRNSKARAVFSISRAF